MQPSCVQRCLKMNHVTLHLGMFERYVSRRQCDKKGASVQTYGIFTCMSDDKLNGLLLLDP